MLNKAIFIDLDHTLIRPKDSRIFPIDLLDWEFVPYVCEALIWLKDEMMCSDYLFIIVTNQGGIEKGIFTIHDFNYKNTVISTHCLNNDITIVDTFFCPTTEPTLYRKPNPGMAYQASLKWDIDLRESVMVGDASSKEHTLGDSDLMFAKNAGMKMYFDIQELISQYHKAIGHEK